jgi:hypothetical protein
VQASRSNAMKDRPGRWDVGAEVTIDWIGAFLEPGTFCKAIWKVRRC